MCADPKIPVIKASIEVYAVPYDKTPTNEGPAILATIIPAAMAKN